MIISSAVFDALRWIAVAYLVASIAAALIFIPKDIDRESEQAGKLRRRILIAMTGLIVLGAIAFGFESFGSPVVIVKIAPSGDVEKTRGTLFRERPYVFQNQHVETIAASPNGTTVVNDSTTPMRVEITSYGDPTMALTSRLLDAPTIVPMMTIRALDLRVDFVGPDDRPPAKVQGIYSEKRYWLTW